MTKRLKKLIKKNPLKYFPGYLRSVYRNNIHFLTTNSNTKSFTEKNEASEIEMQSNPATVVFNDDIQMSKSDKKIQSIYSLVTYCNYPSDLSISIRFVTILSCDKKNLFINF